MYQAPNTHVAVPTPPVLEQKWERRNGSEEEWRPVEHVEYGTI